MTNLSVVIICKNEAHIIGRTLQSLEGLTDDVIVYDNGSADNTLEIVRKYNVRLYEGSWEGFGQTKRKANQLAKYDWILSLDADESIDAELKKTMQSFTPANENTVFDLTFKNFFGNKWLKYGEWGGDHHIRVFNRRVVNWDDAPVHENLVLPSGVEIKKLKGYILHQTIINMEDYAQKMVKYAILNADKYYQVGKTASFFKLRFSPGFTFFNYYILRLGFLDGHAGWVCAKMTAWYTFLKYAKLREMGDTK
jgi:glycosyltransferase involved in cell wall biosynthesis